MEPPQSPENHEPSKESKVPSPADIPKKAAEQEKPHDTKHNTSSETGGRNFLSRGLEDCLARSFSGSELASLLGNRNKPGLRNARRRRLARAKAPQQFPVTLPELATRLHPFPGVATATEPLHILFNVRTATLHRIHVINMTLVPVEPHQVNATIHTETTLAANNPAPHSGGDGAAFGTGNGTLPCFNP